MKYFIAFFLIICALVTLGQNPVNSNSTQTTKNILTYLYSLKGSDGGIMAGQESMYYNWADDSGTPKIAYQDNDIYNITGKYPAVYSCDFGDFGDDITCPKRDNIINAVRDYASRGSIITLSYHIRPASVGTCAAYETIKNSKNSNGNYITLSDAQIDQMITPRTSQYNTMLARFDQLAVYFKDLENDDITILWRPFHEMNKGWFWWGGLTPSKFIGLWNMMYDRLVNYHGCNNLLWVWSCNYYASTEDPSIYYPGHSKVDILGVDVYTDFGHSYEQYLHDDLTTIGGGKPIAISENGQIPDVNAIKNNMPNFVYWLTWYEHYDALYNSNTLYQKNYSNPYTITLDELPDFY